ncbi:MAG: type II toxin-antitoxin system VapC family toxin [Hyphomicrobiales bacterium]
MFVDASAFVAMLTREKEADTFLDLLDNAVDTITSPIAVFETVIAVARKRASSLQETERDVIEFAEEAAITVVEVTQRDCEAALHAFSRFGKGRHPAGLNMGDCFAYACAKIRNVPLLFKSEDFIHTDIEIA